MPVNARDLLLQANSRAEGLDNPVVSIGLNGIADWSTQMPFIDISKQMRPWFYQGEGRYLAYDAIEHELNVDENGWPLSIPPQYGRLQSVFDWGNSEEWAGAAESRQGIYHVKYEGEGDLEIIGMINILHRENGHIVFETQNGGGFIIILNSTDPEMNGNYIRNMSIVHEDNLELHEVGGTFNPKWIEKVKDFRQFRYMDWFDTNNSPKVEWADQNTADTWSYVSGGAPLEVAIRLANETGTDPWLNIPHLATDNHVRQIATYVRENLDPALKATIELGNEPWNNGVFAHTRDFIQLAAESFPYVEQNYGTQMQAYGMRSAQVMRIFTEEFDGQLDRIVRVAQTTTDNTWVTEQIMEASAWEESDQLNYFPPHTYFDALAVTTYFGATIPQNEELRNQIIAAEEVSDEAAFDLIASMSRDPEVSSSIPRVADALQRQQAFIAEKEWDLDLVSYEGGQHIHHLAGTDGSHVEVSELMGRFVRSEQMADIYVDLNNMWNEVEGQSFMQFVDVGSPGRYGSWGLYSNLNDTNPRAEVLEEINASGNVSWEHRPGDHFQQGVISKGTDDDDTLVGTRQEDYLLAGRGDDILVGGLGNDGLHGGWGADTIVLSGSPSQYTVSLDGDITVIEGPDGRDNVVNVEYVEFENGERLGLANGEFVDAASVIVPQEPEPIEYNGGGNGGETGGGETGGGAVGGGVTQPTEPAPLDLGTVVDASLETNSYVGAGTNTTISYENATDSVALSLQAGRGLAKTYQSHTFENVQNVVGSNIADGEDWIQGNDQDNILQGLAGHDSLDGLGGADVLDGGEGWDTVSYGSSPEGVTVDMFNNVYRGGHAEGDVLIDIEAVFGSSHNDTIAAGETSLFARGLDGHDTLISGPQGDTLQGGQGWDLLSYRNSTTEPVALNFVTGVFEGTFAAGDTVSEFEGVEGTWLNDIFILGNQGMSVYAGEGHDTIYSGLGFDEIALGGGSDTLVFTASVVSETSFSDDIFDFDPELDTIDLTSVFAGTGVNMTNIRNYVRMTESGNHTELAVDVGGTGYNFQTIAVLQNTSNMVGVDILVANDIIAVF